MNCKRIENAVATVLYFAGLKEKEKPGFVYNLPKSFVADYAIVKDIFAREEFTVADRKKLLAVYSVADHTSGKIEGICSCDSSAHGCEFCQKMRKAAEKDSSIICGYCYDYTQEERWWNTLLRHAMNLEIMATVEFTQEELKALPITELFRVNSSGDTENVIHAKNMIRIIYDNPESACGYWTKNIPAVDRAIDEIGKPANMIYIQSSIRINKPDKMSKYADYLFTVYSPDRIAAAMQSGACECNGKKCMACGFKCYKGLWPRGAEIAEKLRT